MNVARSGFGHADGIAWDTGHRYVPREVKWVMEVASELTVGTDRLSTREKLDLELWGGGEPLEKG